MPNNITNVGFSDYAAEQEDIARRRAYAQALQQQGQQPMGPTETVGGWAVKQSPLSGLAKMLQAYGGRKGQEEATERLKALQERQRGDRSSDLTALAAMLRGDPGGPQDTGGGDIVNMPAKAAGIDPAGLGQLRTPEVQNMGTQMFLQQLQRQNAPPERVDLGDRIGLVKDGQIVGYLPKGATPDATLKETGANQRHALPSGSAQLGAQTTLQTHATPSAGALLTDARTRAEGAANRGVALRGQDLTDARAQMPRRGAAPLSATAQKELFEADDIANAAQNAIGILQSIIAKDPKTGKSQNDAAYEGGTANVRRIGMSFVPGSYEGESASVDLQNKVTGQALENLKAIFGGMPTEGERKILLDMQGSLNQKAPQREAIFKRAIELAKRRQAINQDKARRLREGTYFGAGTATNQEPGNDWAIVR